MSQLFLTLITVVLERAFLRKSPPTEVKLAVFCLDFKGRFIPPIESTRFIDFAVRSFADEAAAPPF